MKMIYNSFAAGGTETFQVSERGKRKMLENKHFITHELDLQAD